MTDDIINSVLFYFVCGSMDVLITAVVLFGQIGREGNPIWNWITPNELLITVILLANLGFGIAIIFVTPYISKHKFWQTAVRFGLYGEGVGRLIFGVIPGILIMKSAGWF